MIAKDAPAPVRLTPALAGVRISPEEFDAVEDCDERYKYELVNGVLIATPPPSAGERGPNDTLGHLLQLYRETHDQGSALDLTLPESEIRTSKNRRRADRVIWTGLGRTPNVRRDLPSIVIEFVSKDKRDFQRDYVDKREEYAEAGIREYWIIDRFRRVMTVIQWDADEVDEIEVQQADRYSTPLLPGFELPLAKLLSVADELDEASS